MIGYFKIKIGVVSWKNRGLQNVILGFRLKIKRRKCYRVRIIIIRLLWWIFELKIITKKLVWTLGYTLNIESFLNLLAILMESTLYFQIKIQLLHLNFMLVKVTIRVCLKNYWRKENGYKLTV